MKREHNSIDNSRKRRRPNNTSTSTSTTTTLTEFSQEEKEVQLKTYLHHAQKLFLKAFKKAKAQQLAKFARKLKGAEKEDEKLGLEGGVKTLKTLSIDNLSLLILIKKLSSLSFFPNTLLPSPPPPPPSTSTTSEVEYNKLKAALTNNSAVKEAWNEITRACAKRAGVEVPASAVAKEKVVSTPATTVKKLAAVISSTAGQEAEEEGDERLSSTLPVASTSLPEKRLSKRALRAQKAAAKAALPKGMRAMNESRRLALEEAAAVSEEEALDSRVVGSDDEESGSGGGDEEDDEEEEIKRELARLGGSGGDSDSDSASASSNSEEEEEDEGPLSGSDLSHSPSPEPTPRPTKKSKLSTSNKAISSSTFLPSLAAGYISYSDSDDEDAQWVKAAEKEDKKEGKERKNRRGQRARRAIWEQKYGSGAIHIVKETGGVAAPSKGKGAKSKSAKPSKPDPPPAAPVFDPTKDASSANTLPVGNRKVIKTYTPLISGVSGSGGVGGGGAKTGGSEGGETLHPSWEAKKRQKELMEGMLSGAKMGKKITFD